jgi:hypothetical protein
MTPPSDDNAGMISERRTRFERARSPAIRLTSDDLAIIRHVARYRFLRSTDIVRLLPDRSPRKLIERLCDLFHAGYLDRPRAQLDYFARSGSAPLIYGLGNKGAGVAIDFNLMPATDSDWTDKNRDVKRPYIEHALLLAGFMVAVEIAVRDRDDIAFIDANSLLAATPPQTQRAKSPWMLSGKHCHGATCHRIAATPDAVFALHFKRSDSRSYFFVEADRGTMPIDRSDLTQSSYRRRLLAYLAAHKSRQPIERLGMGNLRVLTVTASSERVASMIATVKDITGGKGSSMFLFATADKLASGDPLSHEWISARNERACLTASRHVAQAHD